MTDDRNRLEIVDDAVLEEILGLSDEEALAQVSPGDVERIGALIVSARSTHGRDRLNRARMAIDATSRGTVPPSRPPRAVHAVYDPSVMTLAARSATTGHGADQAGVDRDLADLEAMDDADREGKN